MKNSILILAVLFGQTLYGQTYPYAPSKENPYGKPHPNAPAQIMDWKELIGTCDCKSVTRVDQQNWADTVMMKWKFKYIMNGWGVQDETFKADGRHSGSIRQYNSDSSRWYVHFYSSAAATPTLSAWEGNREGNKIILFKDQKAPNGFDGFYRITFADISENGFNWIGEWTSVDQTIVYPTWRIFCRKNKE